MSAQILEPDTVLPRTTRLAPSPTGALHLGNAWAFVLAWTIARQRGWQVVLRIDDLDGPRIKRGAAEGAIRTLEWLGLDWDHGPVYESSWTNTYRELLVQLAAAGQIYPCRCTRSQIQQAALSAPHGDSHELRYPGTCRPPQFIAWDFLAPEHDGAAWRISVPGGLTEFNDQIQGPQAFDVGQSVGDFLVATKERYPTYQLAVVIDDDLQGITDVIRGVDLLSSTARQILIQRLLGVSPVRYWHTPLVVGPDGLRLAKRHGDTRVEYYAEQGVRRDRVWGLLGFWAGLQGQRQPLAADEFVARFCLKHLPLHSIVFDQEDHDWLMELATR